ncbi:uncharacterized protein [Fopius arisanus]|uniref:Uncharacterized protein n=1 Tax=Fopius arisanus TaxID=64838 RepID=A0A9R1SX47_9HYME|nr:PREDICTED: uncharacterized protein LOC105263917 [Fopius arisanus]
MIIINDKMQFYVLLAAFAAFSISQTDAVIDRMVDWVKDTINETEISLDEYSTAQLDNTYRIFTDYHDNLKSNASASIEYQNQPVAEDFTAAAAAGKDVDKCRRSLDETLKSSLAKQISKIDRCFRKYVFDFKYLEDEINQLHTKGKELQENLNEILEICEEKPSRQLCLSVRIPRVKLSVITWKSRVGRAHRTDERLTYTADKKIPKCVNPLLIEFKQKLRAINIGAKRCIAGSAVISTTTIAPAATEKSKAPEEIVVTEKSVATVKPIVPEVPAVTQKSVVTEKSAATGESVVTEKSTVTAEPAVTDKSAAAAESAVTDKSAAAAEPVVTDKSAAAAESAVTDKSAAAAGPVVTEKSAVTVEPAVTDKSAATPAPVVTEKSVVTPEPVVADKSAAAAESVVTDKSAAAVESVVTDKSAATPDSVTDKSPVKAK